MRRNIRRAYFLKWGLFSLDSLVFWGGIHFLSTTRWAPLYFFTRGVLYVSLVLSLYAFSTYHYSRLRDPHASFLGVVAASVSGFLVGYAILKVLYIPLGIPVLLFFCLFVTASFGMRLICVPFLRGEHLPTSILVVGDEKEHALFVENISRSFLGKLSPQEYVPPRRDRMEVFFREHPSVFTVLVATPEFYESPELREYARELKAQGMHIVFLPLLAEQSLGCIPLSVATSFQSYYSIAFEAISPRPSERVMSLLMASFGMVLFLPIMICVALAIFLESRGPVLFRQDRVGLNGSIFTLYKFRTMRIGKKSEEGDLKRDEQRLTRVGRFLRKTRLDELPQFWNVLKNDMNIVGPRPEMPKYVDMCADTVPFYLSRHNLRPGITGWAQINYKYTTDLVSYKTKTEYDLYYVKNQSFLLDMQIVLKTIETALMRKGSC